MIEYAITAFEKVAEFVKSKRLKKENLFGSIIDPIFKQTELIVQDLHSFIREAQNKLGDSEEIDRLVRDLISKRDVNLIGRKRIQAQVKYLAANIKNETINKWLGDVKGLLYYTHNYTFSKLKKEQMHLIRQLANIRQMSSHHGVLDLLRFLSFPGEEEFRCIIVKSMLASMASDIENQWEYLSSDYLKMKSEFLVKSELKDPL